MEKRSLPIVLIQVVKRWRTDEREIYVVEQ
jgi:hypothetical protein